VRATGKGATPLFVVDLDSLGGLVGELPAVAFECTPSGEVRAISAYWTELTGQPLAEALGRGWTKHLDNDSLSRAFYEMAESVRKGEVVRFAVRCRDRQGQWLWLRAVARPRLEGGVAVGLVGVATLVPADAVVEEETRLRLEEAERLASRADALLSASPDLLFHVSSAGVHVGFRASDRTLLYVTPEQFLGRTLEEVLPPKVALQARTSLQKALSTGQIQQYDYELEVESGLRTFEARVLPMKTDDVLYVVRDVTENRRNDHELVKAREEALERSRLKTQFLANVSHEIRTPLNGILGVTQLLKQHSLPPEFSEYVDVLQGAGESLLAIVDDVLDLSKIEANRLELESRVFDLERVVSETARSFLAVAQRKKLELLVDIAPGARGPVRGDPTRVRQIINNLVGNALKFTDAGSVQVTVARVDELKNESLVRGPSDRVRITVKDTGPGIAAEHHVRIFEAFEQADVGVQRRFGGTGLGLAITRRIARLMGGEVTLVSALKVGSTFELEVPLPTVVISHAPPQTSRVTPAPRPLRVLLAEDDPVNASMTAALLRKLGHAVQVVSNGQDCVEEAAKGQTDLVLMDVHMPVLDGLKATGVIREQEKNTKRHLPIVALTANAMKGDDIMCLSAGMDAYLPKPVTVTALKDLLMWFGSQDR
jgi:signal transduction histidine kinase/CheY-like chemotaxis protein